MALQPILNKLTPDINGIYLHTSYSNEYFDMTKTTADNTHIHSCYEIYINLSGDISFFHNGKIYDIQPGDIILSHPADIHYCIYHSSCIHEHYCVWFVNEFIGDLLLQHGIKGRIRPSTENKEYLINILFALHSDTLEPFYKLAYLIELIAILDDKNEKSEPKKISNELHSALCYVDTHLTEISSVSEVAQALYISVSTLNRMFRAQMGIPFSKYLETKRLALAEQLLRSGHSVTNTCFSSGFTDISRFISKFKNKFGTTPLKYQKQQYK